jgi:hypothetical protein
MEYKRDIPNEIERKAYSSKDPLTFEEFKSKRTSGMKILNNFPALFYSEGMSSEILRGQSFFQKFKDENGELEESLTRNLSELSQNGFYEIPEDIMEDLYQAYLIMLKYDEIKTSDDLFR